MKRKRDKEDYFKPQMTSHIWSAQCLRQHSIHFKLDFPGLCLFLMYLILFWGCVRQQRVRLPCVSAVKWKRSFWGRSSHKACLISERKWGIRLSSRFSHPSLMGHLSWESWRRSVNEGKTCSFTRCSVALKVKRQRSMIYNINYITFTFSYRPSSLVFLVHQLHWHFERTMRWHQRGCSEICLFRDLLFVCFALCVFWIMIFAKLYH